MPEISHEILSTETRKIREKFKLLERLPKKVWGGKILAIKICDDSEHGDSMGLVVWHPKKEGEVEITIEVDEGEGQSEEDARALALRGSTIWMEDGSWWQLETNEDWDNGINLRWRLFVRPPLPKRNKEKC